MTQNQETTGKTSDPHETVGRVLTAALTLGDERAWHAFATVARARLDELERAALSFASLRSQQSDQAEWTAEAAIRGPVHTPLSSFLDTEAGRQALFEWRREQDRRRARR